MPSASPDSALGGVIGCWDQCAMDAIATVARGKLSDGELIAVHFEDLRVRSKLRDSIALGAPTRSSGGGAIH